jgi:hypothetical protein
MSIIDKIDKFLINEIGDEGPSDLKMARYVVGKEIKKAKSKKDLDKIYNSLLGHVKRWKSGYSDEVVEYIKSEFEKKMKEFN